MCVVSVGGWFEFVEGVYWLRFYFVNYFVNFFVIISVGEFVFLFVIVGIMFVFVMCRFVMLCMCRWELIIVLGLFGWFIL